MTTQNMEMEEINERRRAWQCAALEHPCGLAGGVLVGCTRLTPHTRFSHCADS